MQMDSSILMGIIRVQELHRLRVSLECNPEIPVAPCQLSTVGLFLKEWHFPFWNQGKKSDGFYDGDLAIFNSQVAELHVSLWP